MNIPEVTTRAASERPSRFLLWREGEASPFEPHELAWGGADCVCDAQTEWEAESSVLQSWLTELDKGFGSPEHPGDVGLTWHESRCLVSLARHYVWWLEAQGQLELLAKEGAVKEWLAKLDCSAPLTFPRHVARALGVEQWWGRGVTPLASRETWWRRAMQTLKKVLL